MFPQKLIIFDIPERFIYNRYTRNKNNEPVDFPITDLTVKTLSSSEPLHYDLFAVSHHHGGLGGGHYTAHAKNTDTGKWYYFNDSSVSRADTSELASSSAYVLFYQLRENS